MLRKLAFVFLLILINVIMSSGCISVQKTLKVTPAGLNYGEVSIGVTVDLNVILKNRYGKPIEISEFTIISNNDFVITVGNIVPINLNQNDTHLLKIEFSPTIIGDVSAKLSISHNASSKPTDVPLVGIGIPPAPEISVSEGTTSFVSGNDQYEFLDTDVGSSSKIVTFMIENIGSANLILTGNPTKIEIIGTDVDMFDIDETQTSSTIIPGSKTSFSVRFYPFTQGVKEAEISIENNDSKNNRFHFKLKGNAKLNHGTALGWIGNNCDDWNKGSICDVGNELKQFAHPCGCCVDIEGSIYIADSDNNRICKWDKYGIAIGWIGGGSNGWKTTTGASRGSYLASFNNPASVFVDSSGFIYIADSGNDRICKWDSNGNAIGWIGGGSNGWKTTTPMNSIDGKDYQSFKNPFDVFVDSSGFIYVADTSNCRICKWDSNGVAIGWIGAGSNGWKTNDLLNSGIDYQSFSDIVGLGLDTSGFIYVADNGNNRICKWDNNGTAIGWIGGGSNGWQTGLAPQRGHDYQSFWSPSDVYADSSGFLFIADRTNQRICKWDNNGTAIGWIGDGSDSWKIIDCPISVGALDYQSFEEPFGVFVYSSNIIYIADKENRRICKWQN